tara:strand:+ start:608 stop:823 length:216 start_codon:yes stop_codon:yes gene_type:complete
MPVGNLRKKIHAPSLQEVIAYLQEESRALNHYADCLESKVVSIQEENRVLREEVHKLCAVLRVTLRLTSKN